MATRQIALLLSLLAAAAAHGIAGVTTPIINATCTAVAHNSTQHTEYGYCVEALSADPAASSATDAHGLAAAAVNLTIANITDVKHVIFDLIFNLERCLKNYGEMEDTVALALDNISAGLAAKASKKLLGVLDDHITDWCNLILVEGYAKRNPIDVENNNVYLVSAMASDITELLLRSHAPPPKVPS